MMPQAERLAMVFNEAYEKWAPRYGCECLHEAKSFDPESPKGKLMIAVCEELLDYISEECV